MSVSKQSRQRVAEDVDARVQTPAELLFPFGLVGCPDWRRFVFSEPEEAPGLAVLASLDDDSVAFVLAAVEDVVPAFLETLAPEDRAALEALGVGRDPAVRLYCTLTVQADDAVTANLLGPLVLDFGRGCGTQVVLSSSAWGTRHLLSPAGE